MNGRQLAALAVTAIVGLAPVPAASVQDTSQSADSAAAPPDIVGRPGPAGLVGFPNADTYGATGRPFWEGIPDRRGSG